jgi:peptide-methionine (S)-S-oxide reductase
MHAVDAALGNGAGASNALPPRSAAAARADAAAVRRLLAEGAPANGGEREKDAPLLHVCASDAPPARRIEVATLLLDAGAHVRFGNTGGRTAIHAAAARGPRALVELLIRRGAFTWQTDADGKDALAYAKGGDASDKEALIELLDRPVIRDAKFREAVAAVHNGDVGALTRLLDAHPRLLTDRAIEPDCYPRDYFRDPRLFWFIANNPILVKTMPRNIVEMARAMIARGVARNDLDYTLELVMSGSAAREQGLQLPLLSALVDAGATPSENAIVVALAHRETKPVEALLARGHALTATIAAGLGRDAALPALLAAASPKERQAALAMAVVNRHLGAARLCLEAGADANAFMPVHKHSTPLHQAALDGDLAMMKLLVSHGARNDIRDKLWNGTPLGWAVHNGRREAEAYLRRTFGS